MRRALWVGPAAALAVAAAMALAAGGPAGGSQDGLRIGAQPGLVPAFDGGVSDYVSRCGRSRPLTLSVHAPSGQTVSVDGGSARSGDFNAKVALTAGQAVVVRASSAGQRTDYHIRCLPKGFPRWKATVTGTPQAQWYLVSPTGHYAAFFDAHGVPVWWKRTKDQPFNPTLLPDGNIAWYPLLGGRIGVSRDRDYEEHRLNGSFVRKLATVGPPTDIHEIVELPNGHYLLDTYPTRGGVDLRPYGGPAKAKVFEGEVQEITRSGRLVWKWSSRGRISVSETGHRWWRAIIAGQQSRPKSKRVYDTVHVNSMALDGPTLIVSMRHDDALYGIDRRSGRIEWKLGGTRSAQSLDIVGDPQYASTTFGGQHDVRVLSDGTVTVYDNSTDRNRRPRVVRYRIDTAARTATLLEQLTDSRVKVSGWGGGARKLTGGDWVVAWGGDHWVTEMTESGAPVLSLKFPGRNCYRVDPVPPGRLSAASLRAAMDRMHPRKGRT
ncbi:MAG: hypothetical protein E6G53_16915 [Actinobacteria bacterium]|nr:MAG: hypothetical protein E6G53_16915 [Actinomycetota bacterium]